MRPFPRRAAPASSSVQVTTTCPPVFGPTHRSCVMFHSGKTVKLYDLVPFVDSSSVPFVFFPGVLSIEDYRTQRQSALPAAPSAASDVRGRAAEKPRPQTSVSTKEKITVGATPRRELLRVTPVNVCGVSLMSRVSRRCGRKRRGCRR